MTEYLKRFHGEIYCIPPPTPFPQQVWHVESPGVLFTWHDTAACVILGSFRQKLNRRSHMRLLFPGSPHWDQQLLWNALCFCEIPRRKLLTFLLPGRHFHTIPGRSMNKDSLQEIQRFLLRIRDALWSGGRGHRFRGLFTPQMVRGQVLTMPWQMLICSRCKATWVWGVLAAMPVGDLWNGPAASFPTMEENQLGALLGRR